MGDGIGAAIPLKMSWAKGKTEPPLAWQKLYNKEEQTYTIKEEVLITNYKAFLTEFYKLIHDDLSGWLLQDEIPDAGSMDEFKAVWSREARLVRVPFIHENGRGFNAMDMHFGEFWLFYSGSYRAYLEGRRIFRHIDHILAKAMTNPLKDIVRFGIWNKWEVY